MVGWHHRLNGHRFGWTLGVGDGQGSLAGYSLWSCQESDITLRLSTQHKEAESIFSALEPGLDFGRGRDVTKPPGIAIRSP